MPRSSSRSSYIDRPIEREEHIVKMTVAVPIGGFKNARVIEKKVTLAKVPRSRILDQDPDT